jgi:hypothetical protein
MAPAKKKMSNAPVVDLDAAEQAARAEREMTDREAPVIHYKGEKYQLVPEMPLEVVVALADLEEDTEGLGGESGATSRLMVRTMRSLFAEGEWDRFMKLRPPLTALLGMFDVAFNAYGGATVGESEASEESSGTTGTQPRQPSKRVTASS